LKDLRSKWIYDVLDLCLMCKGCKAECPSNVDLAKLKAEFLSFYYEDRLRPIGHALMAHIHRVNSLASRIAPLVNGLQRSGIVRWLLEKAAGIDRRRSMPAFHYHHFRRWFARHSKARRKKRDAKPTVEKSRGKVILLDDCFTTFSEPRIGEATVRILEHLGCEVELAQL